MNFCHCEKCNSQTTLDNQGACNKCNHVQSWKELSNVKNVQRQSENPKKSKRTSKEKEKSNNSPEKTGV